MSLSEADAAGPYAVGTDISGTIFALANSANPEVRAGAETRASARR